MKRRIIPILIAMLLFSAFPAYAKVEKDGRLWQDESVYSIVVDRFNNGDIKNDVDVDATNPLAYNGGDFQGIIDKLDYIHDMGFTTIRLTPIFDNAKSGYHGYWVTDFYKTDEHFGSLKTFQKLIKEAHKRKMKVILDFVTNNVAPSHPWVSDTGKQKWFHPKQAIKDWDNQQQIENGWVDGLPDLNQENPEVSKYLIDAAKWWVQKTNIDGYSLPEVNHVPLNFWSDFSKAVKKEKKDFFLLGIPSKTTSVDVNKYQAAGLDSVLDFGRSQDLRQVFAGTDQTVPAESTEFDKNQKAEQSANFLDNENTVRFTHDIVDKRQFPGSRWKTALTYLYTTPGIPVVYYGTEIALNGTDIPDNRRQMNFRAEKEMIDYITKIAELRNQLPSLTRGTFEMLYNKDGMIVYKRIYKGETSVVAINNTNKSQKVTLTADQLPGGKNKELRGLLEGDLVRSHKGQYILIQDRDHAEIYVLTEKTGINIPLVGSLTVVWILVFVFLYFILKRRKRNSID
ncbi:alpha-amylase family glycosyl hydrolase [Neobacillus mesonae]|uniref:alpha-amylase family glycosyl hydrolase n=1 Tax=Neobacillus mesonae TaxID=1193713 RepID=UPI000836A038|nr:alpha-amylase family glycosyl hydrolase [Neobacillus mesonae]MED4206101.1 alpha-amylase family glycosyl hydrolase [Neobacillus mesonae]